MKMLLVAATAQEIGPFCETFGLVPKEGPGAVTVETGDRQVSVLVTGAGMTKTAYWMGRYSKEKYDLAVNAGVAGAFGAFSHGEVVNVTEDRFAEMGAEDGEEFIAIDELKLGSQQVKIERPFRHPLIEGLQRVSGITVNTVHGHGPSIERVLKQWSPDVESMEGAAFAFAANAAGWPALQLRAISNKVERRNRESWQLGLAITNLNKVIIELVQLL
jgi:futalosine hydrolase